MGLLPDPVAFWERRHATSDPWRSGGDRGLSPEENFEFYAYRLGRLIELIRRNVGADRPLSILDAGCGRGHLTDGLRRCGHHVTGIDASASALEWAREHYGPWFEHCALDAHRPRLPYDVILCIDVLFHILDDDTWRASMRALSRYASAEALMIVTDVMAPERFELGDYIVHRSRAEYEHALADADFEIVEYAPYAFGSNPNGLAACRRTVS